MPTKEEIEAAKAEVAAAIAKGLPIEMTNANTAAILDCTANIFVKVKNVVRAERLFSDSSPAHSVLDFMVRPLCQDAAGLVEAGEGGDGDDLWSIS
eukprot:765145-Hanusia_phi.AAC.2